MCLNLLRMKPVILISAQNRIESVWRFQLFNQRFQMIEKFGQKRLIRPLAQVSLSQYAIKTFGRMFVVYVKAYADFHTK